MSILLAVLNAGALCVADTDVCAPPNSTLHRQPGDSGERWTVDASAPMTAFGVELQSGTITVVVAREAVTVRGYLARETVISGASVAGMVEIARTKGQPGAAPQLVFANDMKRGRLEVFDAGTVDVTPGMRIQGTAQQTGGTLDIASQAPIHGLGLDFVHGPLWVERSGQRTTIRGTLARPGEVAGVLVTGPLDVTVGRARPEFRTATFAGTTGLELLGLPRGTAPAGTKVTLDQTTSTLSGPGPVEVCGTSFLTPVTLSTFDRDDALVHGTLARAGSEVRPGVRMAGPVTMTYEFAACRARGADGILAAETVQSGLTFAANTVFSLSERDGVVDLRGTLVGRVKLDGLTVTGLVHVRASAPATLQLVEGVLAAPAPFEAWRVPAGTTVQRRQKAWSFETPSQTPAKAIDVVSGERFDGVIEASSQPGSLGITFSRPHRPRGSALAFAELTLDRTSGCLEGRLPAAQRSGIFSIPAGGVVTLCNGQITGAIGPRSPMLQVGTSYATDVIAAPAGSPAPTENAPRPPRASPRKLWAYWIQIASQCESSEGTRPRVRAMRWVWVDRTGRAPDDADRAELSRDAAKPGAPCPP